jgi:hypothetical protein
MEQTYPTRALVVSQRAPRPIRVPRHLTSDLLRSIGARSALPHDVVFHRSLRSKMFELFRGNSKPRLASSSAPRHFRRLDVVEGCLHRRRVSSLGHSSVKIINSITRSGRGRESGRSPRSWRRFSRRSRRKRRNPSSLNGAGEGELLAVLFSSIRRPPEDPVGFCFCETISVTSNQLCFGHECGGTGTSSRLRRRC